MPQLKPAGIGAKASDEHVHFLSPDLDPEVQNRPRTPENIAHYRSSFQKKPGQRFISTGLVNQPLPPTHTRYGVRSAVGESAQEALRQSVGSEMDQFLNAQKESIYRSTQREPLGRSYHRKGHALPPQIAEDSKFRFGIRSASSENAKKVIYAPHPRKANEPDLTWQSVGPQAKRASVDMQGSTVDIANDRDVCHQHSRNYAWKEINPDSHRFGKPAVAADKFGVKDALNHDVHRTVVGSKRVDQITRAQAAPLGRTKNFRDYLLKLPEDYTFGSKSSRDDWGAKKCIRGDYSAAEQMGDEELGRITQRRSIKIRLKNEPQVDTSRRFGMPSLRSDIKAPAFRSVADTNNYGDESDAMGLLYPSKFAYDGVDITDFQDARSAEELREIFVEIGMSFSDNDWNSILDTVVREGQTLSVDAVRDVINRADARLNPASMEAQSNPNQTQNLAQTRPTAGKFKKPVLIK